MTLLSDEVDFAEDIIIDDEINEPVREVFIIVMEIVGHHPNDTVAIANTIRRILRAEIVDDDGECFSDKARNVLVSYLWLSCVPQFLYFYRNYTGLERNTTLLS